MNARVCKRIQHVLCCVWSTQKAIIFLLTHFEVPMDGPFKESVIIECLCSHTMASCSVLCCTGQVCTRHVCRLRAHVCILCTGCSCEGERGHAPNEHGNPVSPHTRTPTCATMQHLLTCASMVYAGQLWKGVPGTFAGPYAKTSVCLKNAGQPGRGLGVFGACGSTSCEI